MDLISIIIPTFNRAEVLLRAVNSVFNQTFKNFELIIVDDRSTDNTEQLLQPTISNNSLQYFKTPNRGVAAARNFGVQKARGNWFAFLDSDDEWLPQKLQEQIAYLENNGHLSIVYTEEIWIRNGVRVNQKKHHQKQAGKIFAKCLDQCFIAPSSVLLRRKLFEEMEGFDENFLVCEDYDLWIKISSANEIGLVSKPLIIKYGGHDDQLSTRYFAMDMWRLKSMHKLLHSMTLLEEDKAELARVMKRKSETLLKGYRKHENEKAIAEIEMILRSI